MIPARHWREMPSHAFRDTGRWIAVLPLAAVEQHGPHLPVGVDAIIAEGLVARAAAALTHDRLRAYGRIRLLHPVGGNRAQRSDSSF